MKKVQRGLFRVCFQPITTLNCCTTCISWEIGSYNTKQSGRKWGGGGSKAVWNFSENSSVLVYPSVPKWWLQNTGPSSDMEQIRFCSGQNPYMENMTVDVFCGNSPGYTALTMRKTNDPRRNKDSRHFPWKRRQHWQLLQGKWALGNGNLANAG